ncbi:MAG: DNA alkylation repair protein [Saprospiraceae bacterium]|nr:DNA alkylation repair protein [Saprospiraceae bacterium]
MAELLKHIYNTSFFDTYSDVLSERIPGFDNDLFMAHFATRHWESLELKQRMAYLAQITNKLLPEPYPEKVETILRLIDDLRKRGVKDQNLEYIFLADIITEHGLHDLKTSIHAIEHITQFTSFEFAGRPFFIQYPSEMMEQMLTWASHPNANVRRYASEGCRPRLPWGLQLKQFVADPSPILPILEQLKEDPSEYVRKSVANNLNDISKDHPHIVINFIRKWHGTNDKTDKMLRQAARTLLKTGNSEALSLFGNHQHIRFELSDFSINKKTLQIGSELTFSFALCNTDNCSAAFRIEYIIRFMKANGQLSGKIFKITDKFLELHQKVAFSKKHRFADLTTRKHYPGLHQIAIVINGAEVNSLDFSLSL